MEVIILIEQDRKHDWFLNNQEQRDFMRANAVKKEGQRNVLPPQVFNGEKYCGVRFALCLEGTFYIQGGLGRFAKKLPLLVERKGRGGLKVH